MDVRTVFHGSFLGTPTPFTRQHWFGRYCASFTMASNIFKFSSFLFVVFNGNRPSSGGRYLSSHHGNSARYTANFCVAPACMRYLLRCQYILHRKNTKITRP